jgi:hypothetical protein
VTTQPTESLPHPHQRCVRQSPKRRELFELAQLQPRQRTGRHRCSLHDPGGARRGPPDM